MRNKKGHNKRAKVGDFAMTLIMKLFVFLVWLHCLTIENAHVLMGLSIAHRVEGIMAG